jgi:integrase
MAIKVKLRQKPISGNRQSLYLDYYPAIPNLETGKTTRREFLGLYIYNNAKPPLNKQHNQNTLQRAEQTRQKRDNELNKPEIYSGYEKEQLKIKERGEKDFVEYFIKLSNKRKASNHDNWVSALKYLKDFTNGSLKFADLDEGFCESFKDYLLTTKNNKSGKVLAQNSAVSYFNKFKATLKQARKENYLTEDLNRKIKPIKEAETQRNFLTMEEVNQLVKTDCDKPFLKRAALFSALTGLRFSDIKNLVWEQLEFIKGNGYFIRFRQQKSDGVETMPISEQAYNLLGERKEPSAKVIEGLKYTSYHSRHLAQWIAAAGITKKITFHCFRHTYATLQLSHGTDLYTVSKMLGHRDLKTTQIYAKIIDKTKRDAADRIKLEL